MATINMLVGQSVTLAAVKTLNGADAPLTGPPAWSTSDATKLNLVPSSDGLSCRVISKGPTGSATVTCTASGTGVLTATHTIAVAATSTALANALAITVQSPPA